MAALSQLDLNAEQQAAVQQIIRKYQPLRAPGADARRGPDQGKGGEGKGKGDGKDKGDGKGKDKGDGKGKRKGDGKGKGGPPRNAPAMDPATREAFQKAVQQAREQGLQGDELRQAVAQAMGRSIEELRGGPAGQVRRQMMEEIAAVLTPEQQQRLTQLLQAARGPNAKPGKDGGKKKGFKKDGGKKGGKAGDGGAEDK